MKFKKGTLVKVVRWDRHHPWAKEMYKQIYIVKGMYITWDAEGKNRNQEWYQLDFFDDIYNTGAYGWQLEEVKIGLKDITYLF